MMNNNNNQSTAQRKNTGLLESLPPIVPSIGFSVQRPIDTADNVAGGTDHLSTPSVMLVESQSNITQQNPTTTTQIIPSTIKLGNRTIQTWIAYYIMLSIRRAKAGLCSRRFNCHHRRAGSMAAG